MKNKYDNKDNESNFMTLVVRIIYIFKYDLFHSSVLRFKTQHSLG